MSTRCITPFYRKDMPDTPLPCGRCPHCQARRTSNWSYRLMQEAKDSPSLFLTLTYDFAFFNDFENQPMDVCNRYGIITKNGFLTLRKNAIPLFMKRLRKLVNRPLKYYAVGEYGGKTKRPHYHLLLFGLPFTDTNFNLIERAWSFEGKSLGNIHFGDVNGASVGYTLKYMCKPFERLHARDDREPQFALMSKGLGKNYLDASIIRYHRSNLENCFCMIEDGKKICMPRYYRERIYSYEEWEGIKLINSFLHKDVIDEQSRLQSFIVQNLNFRNYGKEKF